jgi:hypothetical protein
MLTAIAILWVLVWMFTLVDLFRRDWGTGVKVLWAIGMLILPVVGVLVYLIVRPPSSADSGDITSARDVTASGERARDHHPV